MRVPRFAYVQYPTQGASSETKNSCDRGCFEPRRQSFPLGIFGEHFPKTETQSHGPWWYPYSILLLERSKGVFVEDWNKGRTIDGYPQGSLSLSLSRSGPREQKVRVTRREEEPRRNTKKTHESWLRSALESLLEANGSTCLPSG